MISRQRATDVTNAWIAKARGLLIPSLAHRTAPTVTVIGYEVLGYRHEVEALSD